MSQGRPQAEGSVARRTRAGTFAAWLAVTLCAVALALPTALARRSFSPDGVGYVATAHNWLEGRGWVDPVLYSFYLDDVSAPLPATAVRPPLLSALLVVPLALGADLDELRALHVLWAAFVIGCGLLVARRLAGLAGATAFGLWVVGSTAWTHHAGALLTEVTAVAALIAVLAAAPRALHSVTGALALSLLVLLAALARPNMAVLYPALLGAALLEHGPRAALRRAPLWTFALCFPLLQVGVSTLARTLTGLPLYAHYGHMLETLSMHDLSRYRTEYPGAGVFVRAHFGELAGIFLGNLRDTAEMLFLRSHFAFVGWLGAPALLWALWRPGRDALALRTLALAALGFVGSGALSLGGFDPLRYPVPAQICLALLGATFGVRLLAKLDAPRALVPAAVLLVLALADLPWLAGRAHADWQSYRRDGTRTIVGTADQLAAHVAPHLPPDLLVAAPDPWRLHLWTGAAALRLPTDLDDLELLHRFLDEQAPANLVTEGNPPAALLDRSPRLQRVLGFARDGGLYRVIDPPARSRVWTAPRPLVTLPHHDPPHRLPVLAQNADAD